MVSAQTVRPSSVGFMGLGLGSNDPRKAESCDDGRILRAKTNHVGATNFQNLRRKFLEFFIDVANALALVSLSAFVLLTTSLSRARYAPFPGIVATVRASGKQNRTNGGGDVVNSVVAAVDGT